MDITARCVGVRLYPKANNRTSRHITIEYAIDPSLEFPVKTVIDVVDPHSEFQLGDQVLITIHNTTKEEF